MHTSSIEEGRKARDCDPPTAVIPPAAPRTPPTPGAHPANEQDEGCPSHGSGFHQRRGVITTPYLPSLGTGAMALPAYAHTHVHIWREREKAVGRPLFDAAVGRPLFDAAVGRPLLMQRWVDRLVF